MLAVEKLMFMSKLLPVLDVVYHFQSVLLTVTDADKLL